MDYSTYRRIVIELCDVAALSAPDAILASGQLTIDDYRVSLYYDESIDADTLLAQVDLGEAPADARERIYRAALEINFNLGPARGNLGIAPDTDRIVYAFRYPLDAVSSGRALLAALAEFISDDAGQHPTDAMLAQAAGELSLGYARVRV